MNVISTGLPDKLIICSAKNMMRTGSPISKTNISPPTPTELASIINWQASGILIKYLVASGWVTVTGPPFAICFSNRGTTLPVEFKTFPNLTTIKRVLDFVFKLCTISSANRFEAPIILEGLTALSVDIKTKLLTPFSLEIRAIDSVPNTLLETATLA